MRKATLTERPMALESRCGRRSEGGSRACERWCEQLDDVFICGVRGRDMGKREVWRGGMKGGKEWERRRSIKNVAGGSVKRHGSGAAEDTWSSVPRGS